MKKFEEGKTYKGEDGIEIEVLARTEKSVCFKFTTPNWWEDDTEKEFRKKIRNYSKDYESIDLGSHWSEPSIYAK